MTDIIRTAVRELRKNQTISEKILWNILRNRKLVGYKFGNMQSVLSTKREIVFL